jgi:hypothetical protein
MMQASWCGFFPQTRTILPPTKQADTINSIELKQYERLQLTAIDLINNIGPLNVIDQVINNYKSFFDQCDSSITRTGKDKTVNTEILFPAPLDTLNKTTEHTTIPRLTANLLKMSPVLLHFFILFLLKQHELENDVGYDINDYSRKCVLLHSAVKNAHTN